MELLLRDAGVRSINLRHNR